ATDNGSPQKHSHVNVNIHVKRAHNAPPRFIVKEYFWEVSENADVGEFIGIVEVENHVGVMFSLTAESPLLPFVINPSTGVLLIDAPLDYEKTHAYNFTVRASSMNGMESSTKVLIIIKDENDNFPYFTQNSYIGYISEVAALNSVVLMENNMPLVIKAR
ncbi:unnamed protein product, partial [Meganyctiphanes norvegica]